MDVMMPRIDGLEASRRIRQMEADERASRQVPIIALSEGAMNGDREKGIEFGMSDCLTRSISHTSWFRLLELSLIMIPIAWPETGTRTHNLAVFHPERRVRVVCSLQGSVASATKVLRTCGKHHNMSGACNFMLMAVLCYPPVRQSHRMHL